MEEKKYIITQAQANAVLAYLAERPFREVFQLIQGVQTLPQLVDPPIPEPPKPEDN